MLRLNGQKVVSVSPHYEHLLIKDDNDNSYFMKYEELLPMFTEFLFEVEKKRSRVHVHPLPADDECRLYFDETFDGLPEKIDTSKL